MRERPPILERLTPYKELEKLVNENNANQNILGYNGIHASTLINVDQDLRLELFIKFGADVNSQNLGDEYHNTPIHLAIANESPKTLTQIITLAATYLQKINYNLIDTENKTPLLLACKMGFTQAALFLLAQRADGADLDIDLADCEGNTPLHYACALGNLEIIQALMQAGANPALTNKNGRLAIDLCVLTETQVTTILKSVAIYPGRDEQAKQNYFHDKSKNALTIIKTLQSQEIASTIESIPLLNKLLSQPLLDPAALIGLKKGQVTRDNLPKLSIKDKEYIRCQYASFTGRSVLKKCLDNQPKAITLMLSYQVDAAWLSRVAASNGNVTLCDEILVAQPHTINSAGNPSLKTALHNACLNGRQNVIDLLLLKNAALDQKDLKGNTALHYLCEKGYFKLASTILDKGANPNIRNNDGETPLQILGKIKCTITNETSIRALKKSLLESMQSWPSPDGSSVLVQSGM